MNDLCTVFDHLLTGIFDVAAGTSVTGRKTHQFDIHTRIYAERPFSVFHGSKALPASAAAVSITDNDANFL
jgi:hypothetical protein